MILLPPEDKQALLKWWDDTHADMERRVVETGYKQANKDLDAAVDVFLQKECEMADVQAITFAGALVKLETALNTVIDDDEPAAYQRMALGALADLKRLLAS